MFIPMKAVEASFNGSPLGRSLGVHGKQVQKLAYHLLGNSYWDKAGLLPAFP